MDASRRPTSKTKSASRKPALPEVVVLGAGIVLLVAFFQLRAGQQGVANAGVEAFEAAAAMSMATAAISSPEAAAGKATGVKRGAPDQSLWSEERISAYHESNLAGGDLPLAILNIDRLAIKVPVYNGADEHNLNRGVARVKGTARVSGSSGNLAIAGHRDGFFRALKDISDNEIIELTTPKGLVEYRVVSTQIVDPSDTHVLAPTEEKTLTLVTCYPFYFVGSAPKRFIVHAVAQPNSET